MSKTTTLTFFDDSAQGWERALYAFLAEKQRRSGSGRTVEAYSRMIQDFFGRSGKQPDQVASQEIFAWAHGVGVSGKEPGSVTIGARMAALSSFYKFLIRMEIVASNPCDKLERPKVQQSPPRGLSADEIRRLLAVIPRTKSGLRDRAIVLVLTLTGRRRTEVLEMKRGDLINDSDRVFYSYRGKGGKTAKRELPRPAYDAIAGQLAAWGKDLSAMDAKESLWPTDDIDRAGAGQGITSGTFYGNLRRYQRAAGLPASGVHILRHSAAKLRRDAGESIEDVSRFLDHSSLAVTTTYLRRLEGQEDRSWRHVAEAIGV
jgi:site-specific recombinase XerD